MINLYSSQSLLYISKYEILKMFCIHTQGSTSPVECGMTHILINGKSFYPTSFPRKSLKAHYSNVMLFQPFHIAPPLLLYILYSFPPFAANNFVSKLVVIYQILSDQNLPLFHHWRLTCMIPACKTDYFVSISNVDNAQMFDLLETKLLTSSDNYIYNQKFF